MYDTTTTRMLLTTAVLAAVAALMAGPATAVVLDVEGGGGATTLGPQPSPGLAGTLAASRTESAPVAGSELDPAIRTAIEARAAESAGAQASAGNGPIPYLSHGIGVDERLFQGENTSLGLTGDSPLTRGDVASVSQPTANVSSDDGSGWTWAGFGAGMAALLAAAMTALYLSTRNRERVALP